MTTQGAASPLLSSKCHQTQDFTNHDMLMVNPLTRPIGRVILTNTAIIMFMPTMLRTQGFIHSFTHMFIPLINRNGKVLLQNAKATLSSPFCF
eukprot:6281710-Amphidinium_carterae.3